MVNSGKLDDVHWSVCMVPSVFHAIRPWVLYPFDTLPPALTVEFGFNGVKRRRETC